MKYAIPVLVIMLALCLANMPYGYYTLIRFIAMVIFGCLAYTHKDKIELFVLFAASALLFQPFVKLTLGRVIWNIVDIIEVVILVYYWIYKYVKKTI